MTGSSSVVISNLAYLVGAVVLAVVLGFVVWYRHRPPRSVESNVESFHRGLRALAPDERTVRPAGQTARPTSTGLRIQPSPAGREHAEQEIEPAADADPEPVEVTQSTSEAESPVLAEDGQADLVAAEAGVELPEAETAAPVVNLTEQEQHQPGAGEAAGDWAGVETG